MLQIVLKGSSSRLRKLASRAPKMTLKDLLIAGRQTMSIFENRNGNKIENRTPSKREHKCRDNNIRPVVGVSDNTSESSSSEESSYCYAVKTTAKNNPTTKLKLLN